MTSIEIKGLTSPDVEVDVWAPRSTDDVYFLLELEIGECGDKRCDLFHLAVATPEGLRSLAPVQGLTIAKRAVLVVTEFSWSTVRQILGEILSECAADDWTNTVMRLQRYFVWEYEDYRQDDDD